MTRSANLILPVVALHGYLFDGVFGLPGGPLGNFFGGRGRQAVPLEGFARPRGCGVPASQLGLAAMGGAPRTWPICERVKRKRPARVLAGSDQEQQGKKQQHAPHSMTSSARSRIDVGNSMPIAVAVLRLTIVSNFVARSTGRSVGLVPFRILSTNVAARRNMSGKLIP
jgi:hypothetical protein